MTTGDGNSFDDAMDVHDNIKEKGVIFHDLASQEY